MKEIMCPEVSIAQTLAPEDIRPGMYVAVFAEIHERLPSLFDSVSWQNTEPKKIALLPCMCEDCRGGEPLKVLEVCLPFVLVKRPVSGGECKRERSALLRTLDVRQHRLVKLSDHYGATVYKMIKSKARKRADEARDS